MVTEHTILPNNFKVTSPISTTLFSPIPSALSVIYNFSTSCYINGTEMVTFSVLYMGNWKILKLCITAITFLNLNFLFTISFLKKTKIMLFHRLKMNYIFLNKLFEIPNNYEHICSQLEQIQFKKNPPPNHWAHQCDNQSAQTPRV